jgi:hypothetical protein
MSIFRPLRPFLVVLAATAALRAQPGGNEMAVNASYSWSSRGDLTRGGKAGEVSVQRFGFQVSDGYTLTSTSNLRLGVMAEQTSLDRTAGTAIPEKLRSLALEVGLAHAPSRQWSLLLSVRPGVYADTNSLTGDILNIPVMAVASYVVSRDLIWSFGARYDGFADNPLLPYAGVHWQFDPAWSLDIAFPRTGLTWKASPEFSLGAYVSMQGGNYRITRDPRPVAIAVVPGLKDSYLDYHEIRAGIGGDFTFSTTASIRADAGVVTDRKFEYIDRSFRLDGGSAAFVAVALRLKF